MKEQNLPRRHGGTEKDNVKRISPLININTDDTDWERSGDRGIGKAKAEKFLPLTNTDNTDWESAVRDTRCARRRRQDGSPVTAMIFDRAILRSEPLVG
jgi:hypothetical protein